MNNFRFPKVIAGVGPTLAKETILSKIINMVDVFRITLSQGFDDNHRKYIETILKLDNSKSIMLETRGNDIRVKNIYEMKVKKGQKIIVDYSEYAQEGIKKIYIDYPYLGDLPNGIHIRFEQSNVVMKVEKSEEDFVHCKVTEWGTIIQYDRVVYDDHVLNIPFLVEKDKKDILRWLEHGIHMIAASWVKDTDDLFKLKEFLKENQVEKMKVFAKIENEDAVKNIDSILDIADGIIIVLDKLEETFAKLKINEKYLIQKAKDLAIPIILTYVYGVNTKSYPLNDEKTVQDLCRYGVDGFMMETMIQEEAPLEMISKLNEFSSKYEKEEKSIKVSDFYEDNDFVVRDYIIYNAYRISQELEIKAIVCFTESGYTTARLASLNPDVPLISFTKSDETYRYLNSLWWVKWYKISPSFNYENLKRIGKEMIRIIFKGNISLDDKIIIVQANEVAKDERTDMINGIELYKFKNI